jgi:transcription initiation factor TFIIE subunit beta
MMGKEKKKVLYFNDVKSNENLQIDEELIKHWRDVAVEGLDENKIDDYLEKQGIASMKDAFANSIMHAKPGDKRKPSQRGRQVKKHNTHLDNLLNEYNPDLVRKPNSK